MSSSLLRLNSYYHKTRDAYLNGFLTVEVIKASKLLVSMDHVASLGEEEGWLELGQAHQKHLDYSWDHSESEDGEQLLREEDT